MGLNDRFLRACRGLPVDRTPVWFMRQAGRYMPEYRAIRARHSILEICAEPELAVEVSLQPVRALGVDAAILFSDILLPLVPMGIGLEFAAGEGPVIQNPIREEAQVRALRPLEARESLANVLKTISMLRQELDARTPLIGFAGAPFTLASYLIEGGSSRSYLKTKQMMYNAPQAWHGLMEKLSRAIGGYLVAQVEAGAQAVQLFDSWAGALNPADYEEYVLPYSRMIFQSLEDCGAPRIHFGTGTYSLLDDFRSAGADVVGLDWSTPLDLGWEALGEGTAVQGNLDPAVLFAPRHVIERQVQRILRQAGNHPGHIFNLGHGILPETPVDSVRYVVDLVHELTARG